MMFLTIDYTGMEWILGLGVVIGLALALTILTFKNIMSFLIYLTFFTGFTVWAGLLDLWVLTLEVVVLVLFVYVRRNKELD